MASIIDDTLLLARATAIKAQLLELDTAISLIANGAQEYRLNTGQTTQNVRRADLAELRNTRAQLWGELSAIDMRVCGTGVRHGVPDW